MPVIAVKTARGAKKMARRRAKMTFLVVQTVYFSVEIMCDKLEMQYSIDS